MSIGTNIIECRTKAALTQQQLADKICITRQALARYEQGQAIPNIMTAYCMAKALGVKIEDFLKGVMGDDDCRD